MTEQEHKEVAEHLAAGRSDEAAAIVCLDVLRDILSRYEVWYQWTGPRSKVEEPWRKSSGFEFYSVFGPNYKLVPRAPVGAPQ